MPNPIDPSSFHETRRSTAKDVDLRARYNDYLLNSIGTPYDRLENFTKYVPRQSIARFLALYEIYRHVQPVHGDVIECGVNFGGGLMAFALFSAILEPYNFQRRIVGFDTFAGFTPPNDVDTATSTRRETVREGGYGIDSHADLVECLRLYDDNRFLNHIPKVELVRGDAKATIPEFLRTHPHTVVSLLHLDFDLYEPTKVACEQFVPRMPKGAVILFDELNAAGFPGETVAVMETLGLSNLRIRRLAFEPHVSYAVIGE